MTAAACGTSRTAPPGRSPRTSSRPASPPATSRASPAPARSHQSARRKERTKGFLMLNRLAVLAAAAPRRLAGLGLLALIVLAVFGAPALRKLYAQDAFNDPGSQSILAQTQIQNA